MNIIPEHLLKMALANKMSYSKPKQYFVANNKSDSYLGENKNQPGVSNPQLNLSHLADMHRGELVLKLKTNNQIGYIFITDDFGEIWYESEIAPFQHILKINTSHFSIGSYKILMEHDGLFTAKHFVK